MSKNQKIWFTVSLVLFLIPEILWGLNRRVVNQLTGDLYDVEFIGDFSLFNDQLSIDIVRILLACQFFGILGLFFYIIKLLKTSALYYFWLALFLFVMVSTASGFLMSCLFTLSAIG